MPSDFERSMVIKMIDYNTHINNIIISPVDGRKINLTGLSRKQLRDIHYQEEVKTAKRILTYPPFSEERKRLLNEGYAFVETLKLMYERTSVESFGASPWTVDLVKNIVKERIRKTQKKQVVYEAGVGRGYAVRNIIEIPHVLYYGCDVTLFSDVANMSKQYNNLILHERTLYEDLLEMEDNLIDVFYADNVIEHLIPDEADCIFELLYRKMKKKGILILFIPNWHAGPHDVTQYYLKKGQRAKGFHFMEMSCMETAKLLCKHRFIPNKIIRNGRIENDTFCLKNLERLLSEFRISMIKDKKMRLELMKCGNYNSYVFSK